jgi:peptidoglycan/LPS O-acetylase OafA/YrhL
MTESWSPPTLLSCTARAKAWGGLLFEYDEYFQKARIVMGQKLFLFLSGYVLVHSCSFKKKKKKKEKKIKLTIFIL